jgi:hypothetical protein
MPAKKATEPSKPEPAKSAAVKSESAEEAGVPIIVRRAIMKDDASAATTGSTEIAKTEEASNRATGSV